MLLAHSTIATGPRFYFLNGEITHGGTRERENTYALIRGTVRNNQMCPPDLVSDPCGDG